MTIGIGPFESIHDTMAFATKDWSKDKNDAWIYGIVCGWSDGAYAELMKVYGWSPAQVKRNKALRRDWIDAAIAYGAPK